MAHMTECGNDFQVRQAPRKRTAEVQVADDRAR